MPDDKTRKIPRDSARISLRDPDEVSFWCSAVPVYPARPATRRGRSGQFRRRRRKLNPATQKQTANPAVTQPGLGALARVTTPPGAPSRPGRCTLGDNSAR